jgi:hypothetical protein
MLKRTLRIVEEALKSGDGRLRLIGHGVCCSGAEA